MFAEVLAHDVGICLAEDLAVWRHPDAKDVRPGFSLSVHEIS